MTDLVTIYNRALSIAGTRTSVSAVDENSREAEVCTTWYSLVRDLVLGAAPWNEAKAYSRMSVLKERDTNVAWATDDPEPGYIYAYAAPSDMIRPRYLSSFEPFTRGIYNSVTDSIFTNTKDAILVYTVRQADLDLWRHDLENAVTNALGAAICMPLHGKPDRARFALEQANIRITAAIVANANTDEEQFESVPDWIQARGSALNNPVNRFIYPSGGSVNLQDLSLVS